MNMMNAVAIGYHMGFEFVNKHQDSLEGGDWPATARYFVVCVQRFGEAETEIGRPAKQGRDFSDYDWKSAIEYFCREVIAAENLPTDEELFQIARRSILACLGIYEALP